MRKWYRLGYHDWIVEVLWWRAARLHPNDRTILLKTVRFHDTFGIRTVRGGPCLQNVDVRMCNVLSVIWGIVLREGTTYESRSRESRDVDSCRRSNRCPLRVSDVSQ